MRASKGAGVPRTASRLIAAAACAVRHSPHASWTSSAASPVCACVPFTNASPSFASRVIAARPAARSRPPSSPSPIIASARCDSGARSPDAPTLPCDGTVGWTPAFNIATISSGRTARTPLVPSSRTLARSNIIARTASSDSGSPTPEAWLRIRLSCSRPRSAAGMRTWASLPKPVVTPYMVSPRATAASTTRRDAPIRCNAPGATAAGAPQRLGIPQVRLDAPVEDQVVAADVRHPQGGIVQRRGPVDDLEHVPVAGHRLEHVARVAAHGCDVDVGQIAHGGGTVQPHAGAAEFGHDPQRRIGGVAIDPEVDIGAFAVLNEAQLACLGTALDFHVVPKSDTS